MKRTTKGMLMLRKAALALAVVVALAGALSCGKREKPIAAPTVQNYSYSRPDEVAVAHMDLDLTVDFDHRVISGEAGFLLENKAKATVVHFDT